jgi:hypothetical protein
MSYTSTITASSNSSYGVDYSTTGTLTTGCTCGQCHTLAGQCPSTTTIGVGPWYQSVPSINVPYTQTLPGMPALEYLELKEEIEELKRKVGELVKKEEAMKLKFEEEKELKDSSLKRVLDL